MDSKSMRKTAYHFSNTFFTLFAAMVLLISPSFPAQSFIPDSRDDQNQETDKELKLLSWNIYMLPPLVKFTGKIKRAHGIVETLQDEDYNIIVFQEAFHKRARSIIREGLKDLFPYAYGPANKKGGPLKTNSGIWVLSQMPLTIMNTINFDDCAGADCWARKGAMLLKGEWRNQPFQLLGTHLQAGSEDSIRYGQYREIQKQLLTPHQEKDVPQILCGDFNTAKENNHYKKMLQTLDAEDGAMSSKVKHSSHGPDNDFKDHDHRQLIDFLFYRQNGIVPESIKRFVKVFEHPWQDDNQDLSDHYAIEARISF